MEVQRFAQDAVQVQAPALQADTSQCQVSWFPSWPCWHLGQAPCALRHGGLQGGHARPACPAPRRCSGPTRAAGPPSPEGSLREICRHVILSSVVGGSLSRLDAAAGSGRPGAGPAALGAFTYPHVIHSCVCWANGAGTPLCASGGGRGPAALSSARRRLQGELASKGRPQTPRLASSEQAGHWRRAERLGTHGQCPSLHRGKQRKLC